MAKNENITRKSLDDARNAIADGRTQTDWARVDAMSQEALKAAIHSDPDEAEAHFDLDWTQAVAGLPPRKEMVNMRLDREVLDWFRGGGKGYQSRINAVLSSYVRSRAA